MLKEGQALLTYEQLAPALYKWASILSHRFPMFERDELVNAVWLMGRIQKVKHIKFASKRAKCDMIDYIRMQTGSRLRRKLPKVCSLETSIDSNGHMLKSIISYTCNGMAEVDAKDLFKRLCKGLSKRDVKVLKLRVLDGLNMREIAEKMGFTQSNASIILERIRERTKEIMSKQYA